MALPAMTNNSPSAGHISWDLFHIQYEGVGYEVAAGSTDQRWVWWRFNAGVPVIEAGASVPLDLTDDDLLLFGNKDGIAIRIQSTSLVDGELLVNGSVFAEAIAANQISTGHIVTAGLDAGVIRFGTMSGERIEAASITSAQLAAGSVTAESLAAEAVTADKIAAGAISAQMISSGDLEATIALLGSLTVGNAEDRHIVMHPLVGFMMADENGNPLVHFPLTTGEFNRFTGDLVAQGFTAMGGAQFRGIDNEISINSKFTLASGLTKPSNNIQIDTSYLEQIPGLPNVTWPGSTLPGWHGYAQPQTYQPDDGSLAAIDDRGGSGFWENKHLRISRMKLSDGSISGPTLTFLPQEGYAESTPKKLEPLVTALASERADMTAPNSSTTPSESWRIIVNGGTKTRYDNLYYPGSWVYDYVARPAGTKSVTIQYSEVPAAGATYDPRPLMSSVKTWHYNIDARRFNNKVEISPDGVTWTTIFDSAVDGTYAESLAGKEHTFPEQRVAYVRDTLNGSTAGSGNYWTEIQAFGYNTAETRKAGNYHGRPIRIGDYWYLLYSIATNSGFWTVAYKRRIGKFDLTGQQVQVFEYGPYSYEDELNPEVPRAQPTLASDGVDLVMAQVRPVDGHVRFQHFDVTGDLTAPYKEVISDVPHQSDPAVATAAFAAGTFDLGSYHYLLATPGTSGNIRAYDAAGVYVPENGWVVGNSGEILWDGTRFLCSSASYKVQKLSTNKSSDPIRAAYTWYDGDPIGGIHETEVGPVTVSTRKPRRGVTFSVPVQPPDAGDVDSPDRGRIYAKQGAYSSTADLDLQPAETIPNGWGGTYTSFSALDDLAVGDPPPTANTFPNGIAAILASELGGFVVKGDGTGDWPYLKTSIAASTDLKIAPIELRVTALETRATDLESDVSDLVTADTALASRLTVLETGEPWRTVGAAGEPAFQSGYNYVTNPVKFTKDPAGNVHIQGRVNVPSGQAQGLDVFDLPPDYCPTVILVEFTTTSNSGVAARVRIDPADGGVSLYAGIGAWPQSYVDLNVIFRP